MPIDPVPIDPALTDSVLVGCERDLALCLLALCLLALCLLDLPDELLDEPLGLFSSESLGEIVIAGGEQNEGWYS